MCQGLPLGLRRAHVICISLQWVPSSCNMCQGLPLGLRRAHVICISFKWVPSSCRMCQVLHDKRRRDHVIFVRYPMTMGAVVMLYVSGTASIGLRHHVIYVRY